MFPLDLDCLGVKDAIAEVTTASDYNQRIYESIARRFDPKFMTPATARRMIEGVVAFARQGGIAPHPDYGKAMSIFGDVKAADSDETFVYARDGKHRFIPDPGDSPQRIREALSLLENNLGPDGFMFIFKLPGDPGGVDEGSTDSR
jgi:hypothetical protein